MRIKAVIKHRFTCGQLDHKWDWKGAEKMLQTVGCMENLRFRLKDRDGAVQRDKESQPLFSLLYFI